MTLTGPDKFGAYTYGDWTISYDPPPVPFRDMDWEFTHRDYDADYDGESWSSNGLGGRCGSLDECLSEIAEIEEDHPHFKGGGVMVAPPITVGEIIQIDPSHKWGACLAVVSEIKSWGVQAYVRIPHNDGTPPGDAYIRLVHEDFEVTGASVVWQPAGDDQ